MATDVQNPNEGPVAWGPLIGLLTLVCALSLTVAASPRTAQPVALIFPPWTDRHVIFDRVIDLGRVPLEFGRVPGVVVVANDGAWLGHTRRTTGAWIALDASFVAALCFDLKRIRQ